MTVKTFTAKDMNEAMRLVRQQLGPDAAIMRSREVRRSGVLGWMRPGKRIEVTATDQPPATRSKPAPRTRRQSSAGGGDPGARHASRKSSAGGQPCKADASPRRPGRSVSPSAHDDLLQKLINLQSVVRKLGHISSDTTALNLPGSLGQLAKQWAEEVPAGYVRQWIDCLLGAVPDAEHHDVDVLQGQLLKIVAQQLPTCDGIQQVVGQRRVVALVGPAGVGKTTMLAKLAAEYHLRLKRRVGLITADNFRIAAVDQLRTFADIMDVPLHVVTTPREMRAAIQQLQDYELVLMDTPGRSPEDEVKLQELKSILGDGQPDEVHLVQSGVSAASHWRRCLERFSEISLTAVMLTKMDEAHPAGHLVPILTRGTIPVSYVSAGQIVPDDLQTADPMHLAKLLLANPHS